MHISFDTPPCAAASIARHARVNASHATACTMRARAQRYYPTALLREPFHTFDRPKPEARFPNAGRDCVSPPFYLDLDPLA